MTQPEYTGADRACDCSPPNICDILAELQAMKDRIENMIVSVQGLPGDHAGNVQLPFSEDIADSTLGVSGTFAGGHAVLQVKDIADHASETADNAQDIAQIAADAANSASQSASGALSKATEADLKAQQASADAGLALAAAEDAQAAVGNSVMDIGPSVAEETQVRVPYRLKDGTQGAFLVPAVDPDSAGVLTPAQFMEVTDHLDTLGRDLNNVRAEYLDKFNLTAVQLVRSKTDWEKSPTIPTLKPNEYALDDGKRALNAKSAGEHPDLVHTTGNQKIEGLKDFRTPAFPRANEFKTAVNIGDLVNLISNIVSPYAFEGKTDAKITSNVSVIGASAFISAKFVGDKTFDLPQLAIIGKYAFTGSDLKKITIRTNTIMLDYRSFRGCQDLARVEFVNAINIPPQCFEMCPSLATLIIRGTTLVPMVSIDALTGTPIAKGSGYVYVPDDLVDAYKQATNWITYASQIKPISELPPEVSA